MSGGQIWGPWAPLCLGSRWRLLGLRALPEGEGEECGPGAPVCGLLARTALLLLAVEMGAAVEGRSVEGGSWFMEKMGENREGSSSVSLEEKEGGCG